MLMQNHSGGDSAALGMVSLLGSLFPPPPPPQKKEPQTPKTKTQSVLYTHVKSHASAVSLL